MHSTLITKLVDYAKSKYYAHDLITKAMDSNRESIATACLIAAKDLLGTDEIKVYELNDFIRMLDDLAYVTGSNPLLLKARVSLVDTIEYILGHEYCHPDYSKYWPNTTYRNIRLEWYKQVY